MRKIVVLDRGWILVGHLEQDGDWFLMINCSVVRRWGTTKGLGELAECGPLKDTILDKQPLTKFHRDQIKMIISCNEDKWK